MGTVSDIKECRMCGGSGAVSNGADERGRPTEKTCLQCGGTGQHR